ncbi:MAG TPA: hypothetical protein VF665_10910, partial [Longimicrobium sp.]|uniref:hypothetical protein n=1 Tax=Longimicrobium sp. TaxID=2029185 RepID=UPI002ED887B1
MTFWKRGTVVLAALAAAGACTVDNTLVHGCELQSYRNGQQYLLDFELIIPSECPVPVGFRGELKRAGAHVYDYGYSDFAYGGLTLRNSSGRLLDEGLTRFQYESYANPNGGNTIRYRAFPSLSYPAATGSRPLSSEYDVGYFVATNTGSALGGTSDPFGEVVISYTQSAMVNRIHGNSVPARNTTVTWSAEAFGGSAPYTSSWYRDGQWASDGQFFTETVSRDFLLELRTTDATMSVRSAVLAVDVDGVSAGLSGPTQIWASSGGGTWTASAVGGTAPYTYTWYINQNSVGTGQT